MSRKLEEICQHIAKPDTIITSLAMINGEL